MRPLPAARTEASPALPESARRSPPSPRAENAKPSAAPIALALALLVSGTASLFFLGGKDPLGAAAATAQPPALAAAAPPEQTVLLPWRPSLEGLPAPEDGLRSFPLSASRPPATASPLPAAPAASEPAPPSAERPKPSRLLLSASLTGLFRYRDAPAGRLRPVRLDAGREVWTLARSPRREVRRDARGGARATPATVFQAPRTRRLRAYRSLARERSPQAAHVQRVARFAAAEPVTALQETTAGAITGQVAQVASPEALSRPAKACPLLALPPKSRAIVASRL